MGGNLRQRTEAAFVRWGGLICRHDWKVLLLLLLLAAGLASQLPKLTLDTSTEGFLHPQDPALIAYTEFREQFGRDELILLTIQAPDVFNQAFLEKLRGLHRELAEKTPYLDDLTSLVNARDTRGSAGELQVGDLLQGWPLDARQLAEVRSRSLENPLYRHMLVSPEGDITTVVLKTDAFISEQSDADALSGFASAAAPTQMAGTVARQPLTDAQNSEVVAAIRAVAAAYASEDFRIHLAGAPVLTDVLKLSMQKNMKKFMLLALAMIALILLLLFRRPSGVLLPLLTVILSLLSTLGVMALLGIPFKLPTQILPSFLLAVGIGAVVHLLSIFYQRLQQLHAEQPDQAVRPQRQAAISHSLAHSGLAIVMTSLTTAAGLASFAGAEVAPISDLGMIAALGVMIALLYTLTLVPALLSLLPIRAKRGSTALDAGLDRLLLAVADFSTLRSRLVLVLSAALLLFGFAGAAQVKFSHKPFEWLPKTEPVRIATDFVNERMRGASLVEVVADTGERNGFYQPQRMQALARLGTEVSQIEGGGLMVGKTLSLADILMEINQALNENQPAARRIPDDRQLIAQEFLLFENAGSDDLEDFVDSQFSKARFTIKMPWADAVLYEDFIHDLERRFHAALGDDVAISVTGMNALLSRTMSATIFSMAQSYLLAGVIITLMMMLLIGDVRIGLLSMIPNLAPIVLTLGVMGWLGLPLDLFTMLIGSIAIGLAVDDTIHFMHNYRRYHHDCGDVRQAVRQTLLGSGRAMLVTTLVLSSGFFLYMGANLSNLVNFGLLTGFTIIMALLADFFLAPALLQEMHRSHLLAADSDF